MPVRHTLALTAEDTARFRAAFIDFARLELASGGPDHHVHEVADLCRSETCPPRDPAWFIGCYMGPYNIPGGVAIYDSWDRTSVRTDGPFPIEEWLRCHWAGIPIRRERRPCRSPKKMAVYLQSVAAWLDDLDPDATYEELWRSLDRVKYIGRYTGMKLLESLRRAGITEAEQPDVRAGKGGDWSPRLALSYLYPAHDEVLNRDSSKAAAEEVECLAATVFPEYREKAGIPDMYHFEVLLCDFKQAVDGKYYPGRPLDAELVQRAQASGYFGHSGATDAWLEILMKVRADRFPYEHLGEFADPPWYDRRKELGTTHELFGYWWSDLLFDYRATEDLGRPKER